jgi:hypothetical protein
VAEARGKPRPQSGTGKGGTPCRNANSSVAGTSNQENCCKQLRFACASASFGDPVARKWRGRRGRFDSAMLYFRALNYSEFFLRIAPADPAFRPVSRPLSGSGHQPATRQA